MTQKQEVKLIDISENASVGLATVEVLGLKERASRASLRAVLFFGIAFVGLFVPFLHFFITPGFTLVGFVAFFVTLRTDKIVPLVAGVCPSCGTKIEFRQQKYGGIQKDNCQACRQMLKIEYSS